MFFLTAITNERRVCTIHVRGFNNKSGMGLVDGEGIFEVKQTNDPKNPEEIMLHVVRQVGVVSYQGDHFVFNFTDPEFKKSINYNENTGYSTFDGAGWQIHYTNYLNSAGNIEYHFQPTHSPNFMYAGAKNPFNKLPSMQTLFSNNNKIIFNIGERDKPDTRNQKAEQATSNRPK